MELPSLERVLMLGSIHNPANWVKHLEFVVAGGSDSQPTRLALDALRRLSGQKASRQHVFDIARVDPAAGVVAAIVWGFPKGGRPGGKWKDFASVFTRAHEYAALIADMQSNSPIHAGEALSRFNEVQPGIGFATTSKIAYFAGLEFLEGPALIYDSNVIKAIKTYSNFWFERTRSALGSGKEFYSRGVSTYGTFVMEASETAKARMADPDQIEAALFLSTANPRSGWH